MMGKLRVREKFFLIFIMIIILFGIVDCYYLFEGNSTMNFFYVEKLKDKQVRDKMVSGNWEKYKGSNELTQYNQSYAEKKYNENNQGFKNANNIIVAILILAIILFIIINCAFLCFLNKQLYLGVKQQNHPFSRKLHGNAEDGCSCTEKSTEITEEMICTIYQISNTETNEVNGIRDYFRKGY